MIIERYLFREIITTLLGVTLLLLLIFMSGTFVRILAEVMEGDFPATVLFSLFGLKSLGNLMLVLPLSFFLAILLSLGRLYRDQEMTAMTACGIGPGRVLKTVALLSLWVGALVAALALFIGPWAEEKGHQLLDVAGAQAEIEGISAGRFNQSGEDGPLVYVEAISADRGTLSNVFAHTMSDGRVSVISAAKAHQVDDQTTGQRYLVLVDGYRYEGRPGEPDFRIVKFAQHGLVMAEREVSPSKRRRNAISSAELWASTHPADVAELQWRIAMPLSVLLLGLLAVPLAKTSPRQGRYGRLFAGIMIYIIYNNLLTVARSWLGKNEIRPELGLWWVHGLTLAVILVVLWRGRRLPGPKRARRVAA